MGIRSGAGYDGAAPVFGVGGAVAAASRARRWPSTSFVAAAKRSASPPRCRLNSARPTSSATPLEAMRSVTASYFSAHSLTARDARCWTGRLSSATTTNRTQAAQESSAATRAASKRRFSRFSSSIAFMTAASYLLVLAAGAAGFSHAARCAAAYVINNKCVIFRRFILERYRNFINYSTRHQVTCKFLRVRCGVSHWVVSFVSFLPLFYGSFSYVYMKKLWEKARETTQTTQRKNLHVQRSTTCKRPWR